MHPCTILFPRDITNQFIKSSRQYSQLEEELVGAQELFESGDDAELKEMARAEIKEITEKLEELESNIKILLLPKDPNDDRNCMLEIRAGTGGSEANIFAGETPNSCLTHDRHDF